MAMGSTSSAASALNRPPQAAPAAAATSLTVPPVALGMSLASPTICFLALVAVLSIEYLGLAQQYSIIATTRLPTFFAYGLFIWALASGGSRLITESNEGKAHLSFLIFTCLGILWAIVRSIVTLQARYHLDYLGLFTMTAWLVTNRKRIDILSMAFVAIAVGLVVQNLSLLQSSVRVGVFKGGYFLGDGNDFAWGLNVMLPFAMNLMIGKRWITTRLYGLAGFGAIVFGTVGTQSRGGTLAIGAALLIYWLTVSKRKALGAVMLVCIAVGASLVAPATYVSRLNTISDYQDDSSSQGRLRAWGAALKMAVDFPLGVGANNFSRAYGRYYIPEDTSGYKAFRWISPHSIYFRVIGEYGYLGFSLLLWLFWSIWRNNRAVAAGMKKHPGVDFGIPDNWPLLLNVGLGAYCVGGIFLGGFAYPHLFMLSGLSVASRRAVEAYLATMATTAPDAQAAPAPALPRWPTPMVGRQPGAALGRPEHAS
jgi:probable O-glycosylation ligase (exosortase A-associated)